MYHGHVTYETMLYMTFSCQVNCYVDKIKLQTQTTINASTHMHCSYHELLQRRDTEKKKINILVWMSKEICASRAIAFWALKLHFFQFNVLLASGDKAFVSGQRGAGAINSLQVNI